MINAKLNDLMDTLLYSGKAASRLVMTGGSKDARHFFTIKKKEQENVSKLELSFIDSLFMMYKLRRKIVKLKAGCKAFDNIRQYIHNFGDYVFSKNMNFRSSYLENIAADKHKELNQQARKMAAEYYLEVLFLQYTMLHFNCELQGTD